MITVDYKEPVKSLPEKIAILLFFVFVFLNRKEREGGKKKGR